MKLNELVLDLARIAPAVFWHSDLDQRLRSLRAAGILENPGRGGRSPEATPRDAAVLLIGAAARPVARTAEHSVAVGSLTRYDDDVFYGASFAEALADILAAPKLAAVVDEIQIGSDCAFASIARRSHAATLCLALYGSVPRARRCVVLSGAVVHDIAVALAGRRDL